jgi:2-desacetyl-2-hydroxyethyl bacteriochlorophyllide A dehydrogenase
VSDLTVGEVVFAATGQVDGMFRPAGGHISPSVSPRHQIWKLPTAVDALAYAGAVLTQVGYNGGTRAPLEVGQHAVVVGDGLVGHWTAQTLAWRGANVVLVGRHDDRLARFETGPLRHVVNTRSADWIEAIRALCPGGLQVAVDTVGSIAVMEGLIPLMRRYGHLVSAGFYGTTDHLALQPLRDRELSVDFISGWSRERIERTLTLIASGALQTLPLITHHFPVSQAAAAWQLINQKDEDALGVILDWEAE